MTPPPPDREGTILLGDDSGDNAELIKISLKKVGCDHPVHAVYRGEEAVEYLEGRGDYADRSRFPLPRIMFLDTRMVGMNGWEVLRWVRGQREFESLPVIVFTGADQPGDKKPLYDIIAIPK